MVIEETAGLSALGFFKKKKKKKPAPEPDETSAAARGLTARLGPDGKPVADGAAGGGGGGGAGYLPYVFIGGALLVVGAAGYFILKK